MKHAALVQIAAAWLERQRCVLVLTEHRCHAEAEQPDAIGWLSWGGSILVECKATRTDFVADQRKPHRKEGRGMGARRYYMAPPGVLTVADLPDGWGLIIAAARCRIVHEATERTPDREAETRLLLNVTRRATGYVPRPTLPPAYASP